MDDYKIDYSSPISVNGKFKYFTVDRFKKQITNNTFEKYSKVIFQRYLNEDSIFIDVGSHHGIYSIFASEKILSTQNIYAIEPVKENVEVIKRNFSENGLSQINIINAGISNFSGNSTFNISEYSDVGGLTQHPGVENIEKRIVNIEKLDNLFLGDKVDFIKIDTEGNELNVLYGAENIIKNNSDIKLLVEFNPKCLKATIGEPLELIKHISSLGFDIYIIDDLKSLLYKIKINNLDSIYSLFDKNSYCNLFCIKNSKHVLFSICDRTELNEIKHLSTSLINNFKNTNTILTFQMSSNLNIENFLRNLSFPTIKVSNEFSWEFNNINDFVWLFDYSIINDNLDKIKEVKNISPDFIFSNSIYNGFALLSSIYSNIPYFIITNSDSKTDFNEDKFLELIKGFINSSFTLETFKNDINNSFLNQLNINSFINDYKSLLHVIFSEYIEKCLNLQESTEKVKYLDELVKNSDNNSNNLVNIKNNLELEIINYKENLNSYNSLFKRKIIRFGLLIIKIIEHFKRILIND